MPKIRQTIFDAAVLFRAGGRALLQCRAFCLVVAVHGLCAAELCADDGLLTLTGAHVDIIVRDDLGLSVVHRGGPTTWQTSRMDGPALYLLDSEARIPLATAESRRTRSYDDGTYSGSTIELTGFGDTDVVVELDLALCGAEDELLVQIAQTAGRTRVKSVTGLYRFEAPLNEQSYQVMPIGSGHLLGPQDGHFTSNWFIGARYSMPIFGLVQGGTFLCAVVDDTWWDTTAQIDHDPKNGRTGFSLGHMASRGSLRYPRRFLVRFGSGGYVEMAKAYRRRLQQGDRLETLVRKADRRPKVARYMQGVEYRWTQWQTEDDPQAMVRDVRELVRRGLKVNIYFPKWQGTGDPYDFARPPPLAAGGWSDVTSFAKTVRDLGCTIKVFWYPLVGSDERALAMLKDNLDLLERQGFVIDALFFDGYCASRGVPEAGIRSRRDAAQYNEACFDEVRRRGLLPGAETPRFWSIGTCDFAFAFNWGPDYCSAGAPIPLMQLIWHDCFLACFAGGGYGSGGDWPKDREPRLYELLFVAMPTFKFAGGKVPTEDWADPQVNRFCDWLRLWSAYHNTTKRAEMLTHEFVDAKRTHHRVRFSNGVTGQFDMENSRFRIEGVEGIDDQWQEPFRWLR